MRIIFPLILALASLNVGCSTLEYTGVAKTVEVSPHVEALQLVFSEADY